MLKKRRFVAMFSCLIIVIALLSSAFFIAKEAHHECAGQDCSICVAITNVKETLRNIGNAIVSVSIHNLCLFTFLFGLVLEYLIFIPNDTLISQKVRLNN